MTDYEITNEGKIRVYVPFEMSEHTIIKANSENIIIEVLDKPHIMTKDETRDTVLNFFKERGQELKGYCPNEYKEFLYENAFVQIILNRNQQKGWEIIKYTITRGEAIGIIYNISNLPSDHKELIVLLNILNPLPT